MTIILALSSILAGSTPLAAPFQDSVPSATSSAVSFVPSAPVQGSAVMVLVRPDTASGLESIAAVRATLAGEALHFEADSSGGYRAVGGVPIDASGAVRFAILIERSGGRVDTVEAMLPITTGTYAMEKLTVAPRFGAAPDSALAARMAREAALAREVSARSHDTPRQWDSTFVRPRETRITSGFGHGREFNGRVQSRHLGVDFAGAVGTPVRAANRGIVALIGEFYLGGNVVYIDHGAGLVTAYLHLSRVEVARGDTVARGQVIGRVGATGRVTGPHLHWIARYGRITINPLSLASLPVAARSGEVAR